MYELKVWSTITRSVCFAFSNPTYQFRLSKKKGKKRKKKEKKGKKRKIKKEEQGTHFIPFVV
jgi:hypothetical protein